MSLKSWDLSVSTALGGQQGPSALSVDCIYTTSGSSKRLTILPNIPPHSPHIHTPTAESTTQGDGQLVGSSLGKVSGSGTPRHLEIEIATFCLPVEPLCLLLSHLGLCGETLSKAVQSLSLDSGSTLARLSQKAAWSGPSGAPVRVKL